MPQALGIRFVDRRFRNARRRAHPARGRQGGTTHAFDRQVLRIDRMAVTTEHERSLDRVAQLSYIAGPRRFAQDLERRRAQVARPNAFRRPSTIPPHVPVDVMPEPRRRLDAPETYTISVSWRVRWRQDGVGVRVALPGWSQLSIPAAALLKAGQRPELGTSRPSWCSRAAHRLARRFGVGSAPRTAR
jgi:hypothetical protein